MSDYREACIERKLVRVGMVEQRPVPHSKKVVNTDWMLVHIFKNRWSIWGQYKTESDARRVLDKRSRDLFSWDFFIVEKEIFNAYYAQTFVGLCRHCRDYDCVSYQCRASR